MAKLQAGPFEARSLENKVSLYRRVHEELQRATRRHLGKQRAPATVTSTKLVNEAFARIVRPRRCARSY